MRDRRRVLDGRADGTIAVESVVERKGQREPVFNLEVAGAPMGLSSVLSIISGEHSP